MVFLHDFILKAHISFYPQIIACKVIEQKGRLTTNMTLKH